MMPPLVSRILISVFMLPLAALIYCVAYFLTWGLYRPPDPLGELMGGSAAWLTVALIYCFAWRTQIVWSRRRITATLLSVVASILLAAVAGVAIGFRFDSDFGFFIASALAPALWLISTPIIWRNTPVESLARQTHTRGPILCPVCKYNLTGLTEARCPECGNSFTLDQLLMAQNESSGLMPSERGLL